MKDPNIKIIDLNSDKEFLPNYGFTPEGSWPCKEPAMACYIDCSFETTPVCPAD
ncbi:hypothetical protein [Oceanotoga teriensis]|uniref:hypothetical protein n=1 Tax=Oceanotoga teriensis TaxID=515440 RepID=UPI0027142691|nr:hypothetical protein [Oceanotoga teriensis]MDO7976482.1 hypothetical protein [Oceanotoga teriensis]